MNPITEVTAAAASTATTAVTAITTQDIEGALELVGTLSNAISSGEYWWAVAFSVYLLLELAKGRVPGTKIVVPQIPKLLTEYASPEALKTLAFAGCVGVSGLFIAFGRPVDAAIADALAGWIGAMGLHESVSLGQFAVSKFLKKQQ